jgi:hypothetical protein
VKRWKAILVKGMLVFLLTVAVIPANSWAQRPPVPPAPSPPAPPPPPAPVKVIPESPDRQRFQPETPGRLIHLEREQVDRYKQVPPPGETTKTPGRIAPAEKPEGEGQK